MEADEDHITGNTAEVVGLSTRKHQDWFDEADKEVLELLEKKRSCHSHLARHNERGKKTRQTED